MQMLSHYTGENGPNVLPDLAEHRLLSLQIPDELSDRFGFGIGRFLPQQRPVCHESDAQAQQDSEPNKQNPSRQRFEFVTPCFHSVPDWTGETRDSFKTRWLSRSHAKAPRRKERSADAHIREFVTPLRHADVGIRAPNLAPPHAVPTTD